MSRLPVDTVVIDASSPRLSAASDEAMVEPEPLMSPVRHLHMVRQSCPSFFEEDYQDAHTVDISDGAKVNQRKYDYAVRDAAARFEEARRLTAELFSLHEQLDAERQAHQHDLRAAAGREAELSEQLMLAKDQSNEREMHERMELGARIQMLMWQCNNSEKIAEDADTERRRSIESRQAAEVSVAIAIADRDAMMRERDAALAALEELQERNLLYATQAKRECEEQAAKLVTLSGRANTALTAATSTALTARQQAIHAERALQKERSAREAAQAVAAQHAAAAAATEAAAAEARKEMDIARAESERDAVEALERSRVIGEQLAAQAAEWAAERTARAAEHAAENAAAAATLALREAHAAEELKAIRAAATAALEEERDRSANQREEAAKAKREARAACHDASESTREALIEFFSATLSTSRGRKACRRALTAWRMCPTAKAERIRMRRACMLEGRTRTRHRLKALHMGMAGLAINRQKQTSATHTALWSNARRLARCIHAWILIVNNRARERRALIVASTRRQRCILRRWSAQAKSLAGATRISSCLLLWRARRSFNLWSAGCCDDKSTLCARAMLNRSLAAMRRRNVWQCWVTWSVLCAERHRTLSNLRGALVRWGHRDLRRAWLTWRALREAIQKLQRMLSAAHRSPKARAWRTWVGWAAAHSNSLGSVRWALRAMEQRMLRCALSSWMELLRVASAREAAYAQLLRAAAALQRQRERRAFSSWRSAVTELIATARRLRAAVNRWCGQGCGRAWSKWRDVCAEAASLRQKLKVLWMRREASALRRWVEMNANASWLRGIIHRLCPANRGIRTAFNAWIHAAAIDARAHAALYALLNRHVRHAFNAWLRRGAALRASCLLLRRSILVLSSQSIARAWRHWTSRFEWPRKRARHSEAFSLILKRRAIASWRVGSRRTRNERALHKIAFLRLRASTEASLLGEELSRLESGFVSELAARRLFEERMLDLETQLQNSVSHAAERLEKAGRHAAAEQHNLQQSAEAGIRAAEASARARVDVADARARAEAADAADARARAEAAESDAGVAVARAETAEAELRCARESALAAGRDALEASNAAAAEAFALHEALDEARRAVDEARRQAREKAAEAANAAAATDTMRAALVEAEARATSAEARHVTAVKEGENAIAASEAAAAANAERASELDSLVTNLQLQVATLTKAASAAEAAHLAADDSRIKAIAEATEAQHAAAEAVAAAKVAIAQANHTVSVPSDPAGLIRSQSLSLAQSHCHGAKFVESQTEIWGSHSPDLSRLSSGAPTVAMLPRDENSDTENALTQTRLSPERNQLWSVREWGRASSSISHASLSLSDGNH